MQHGYRGFLQNPPFLDDFPIQMSIYLGDFPASHVSHRGVCFFPGKANATGMFWTCGSQMYRCFPETRRLNQGKIGEFPTRWMDFNNQTGG